MRQESIGHCIAEILNESNGAIIFNPHAYTIEDGGMKQVDLAQLKFKQQVDPYGLMNPGKMKGWNTETEL